MRCDRGIFIDHTARYDDCMCARYRLKNSLRHIADRLGLTVPEFEEFSERPRLNITISQRVPIVKIENGKPAFASAEWGFLAPWDRSKRIFNAAAETIASKRTFSQAFKQRRCLIPADGFYEWPKKKPTLIHYRDDRLFCFAGLWSSDTMTMITCAPNDFMKPIHHRMPAILPEQDYTAWLDPDSPMDALQSLVATRNWADMEATAIPKLKPDNPPPAEQDPKSDAKIPASLFDEESAEDSEDHD
jgi:putative SOS response-associated peptidase YedK